MVAPLFVRVPLLKTNFRYFKVTRVAMIAIPSGEEESPRYPTHEITQREAEETEEERKERENGSH
mgnify:CR=1 FL=1